MRGLTHHVAALMLTCFTGVTLAAPLCAGWQPTRSQRMACCAAADHSREADAADDCCADGEQRQNAERTAPVVLPSGDSQPASVLSVVPRAVVRDTIPRSARPDVYLLDSVLLI